ncbi:MAG: tellurite resistance TerB family protein [Myxococcota bacterium]
MKLPAWLGQWVPVARLLRRDSVSAFQAALEGGFLVAAADGTVDVYEHAVLRRAVHTLMESEPSEDDVTHLLASFRDRLHADGADARCAAVGRVLATGNLAQPGLKLAAAIAYCSGGLDARELATMEKLARAAGVEEQSLRFILQSVEGEVEAPG